MTPTDTIPEYADISGALRELDADVDAAEGHGILCGMVCAGGRIDGQTWLADLADAGESASAPEKLLHELYEGTVLQLGDPHFGFELLLPRDSEPLNTRTQALSHWCAGYLYGLGMSGVTDTSKLPAEVTEVLTDLAQIAGVDYRIQEAGEPEENAYTEVVEYVRMGALLILEYLRGPQDNESIH